MIFTCSFKEYLIHICTYMFLLFYRHTAMLEEGF